MYGLTECKRCTYLRMQEDDVILGVLPLGSTTGSIS
jgi:hypothetical protein